MKHGVLSGKNTILLSTLRRSFPWAWALFLACCGLLSAWGGVAASHAAEAGYAAATPPPVTPPATATPEPFMPVIEEFRCEPCAIDAGET
ncbi:MAG: hypothetical protein NZ765_12985, partial [Anaerolineae bacterium]|nr:hypothetical protein [Anaerolineae bacterium]